MYTNMRLYTKDYLNFKVIDDAGNCITEFQGVQRAQKALPGDEVNKDGSFKKRVKHPPIVGVLKLNNKIKYGLTSRNVPIHLFEPMNKAYPHMLVSSDQKSSCNVLAVIQFEAWDQSRFPRGSLIRIIGDCGSMEAEAESLLLRYSPLSYPKKFEISPLYETELSNRAVLPGFTFNIDPPGCEDVDDVFTVEKTDDIYTVSISIKDVASAIEPESVLDIYASNVGQTLYPASNKPKHMLPPSLGIKCLSLLPGKSRNCITLSIKWSADKGILDKNVSLTRLSVDEAFTYDEADNSTKWYMNVIKCISESIHGSPLPSSHEWVETLMIYYNTEIGNLLHKSKTGILRAHDAPDVDKLKKILDIDESLKMLAYSSAKYVAGHTDSYHWGLLSKSYAHASSPLRRYADLFNQQCLHKILKANKISETPAVLCSKLNMLGKDAKSFERDTFFLNHLSHEAMEVEGILVDIIPEKEKVQVWVSRWNRMIRVPCTVEFNMVKPRDGTQGFMIHHGVKVKITYMINYESARWKDRILFRIVEVL